jgi:hypothetical protein
MLSSKRGVMLAGAGNDSGVFIGSRMKTLAG